MHSCNECNFSCDRPFKLKDHQFTRHRGGAFTCDTCEASFLVRKNLQRHKRIHNDSSRRVFRNKKTNHELKEVVATILSHNSCSKPEVLEDHKTTKHTGLKYECQNCQALFSKSKILKEHFSGEHEPESKFWACNLCGYSTRFNNGYYQSLISDNMADVLNKISFYFEFG